MLSGGFYLEGRQFYLDLLFLSSPFCQAAGRCVCGNSKSIKLSQKGEKV